IQPEEAYKVVSYGLEQTVSSLALLEALDREARQASVRVNVHVKVETGLGRIGVDASDAVPFLRQAMSFKNVNVEGLFSHFSSADERDKTFARRQLRLFEQITHELHIAGLEVPKRHMANSAAILDIPESYYDMVRPGIMIYGLYPSTEVSRSIELKPAMTLKTRVSQVKTLPAGSPVSYGGTFVTRKETDVAILPIGYADGYSRLLANRAEVMVKGHRVPQVGRICMDMCMIDVSGVEDVQTGDEVILFGEDPPVEELAEKIGTINYEVVSTVGKRVPRIYVDS
ncbi:MAG: alanine racemase, partial [Dehalococcoidia bacterium]|nr:alanine racemase [Dehalococcoidia bacterium]